MHPEFVIVVWRGSQLGHCTLLSASLPSPLESTTSSRDPSIRDARQRSSTMNDLRPTQRSSASVPVTIYFSVTDRAGKKKADIAVPADISYTNCATGVSGEFKLLG